VPLATLSEDRPDWRHAPGRVALYPVRTPARFCKTNHAGHRPSAQDLDDDGVPQLRPAAVVAMVAMVAMTMLLTNIAMWWGWCIGAVIGIAIAFGAPLFLKLSEA
jgi:hypothetical protein